MAENKIKYIEQLIAVLESDKKSVLLYIAFEIGIVVFTVKDLTIGKGTLFPDEAKIIPQPVIFSLLGSLALFLLAAWMHFLYYRRLHLNIVALVQHLLEETAVAAKTMVFDEDNGLWAKHGWKYTAANTALAAAVLLYFVFLILVLL